MTGVFYRGAAYGPCLERRHCCLDFDYVPEILEHLCGMIFLMDFPCWRMPWPSFPVPGGSGLCGQCGGAGRRLCVVEKAAGPVGVCPGVPFPAGRGGAGVPPGGVSKAFLWIHEPDVQALSGKYEVEPSPRERRFFRPPELKRFFQVSSSTLLLNEDGTCEISSFPRPEAWGRWIARPEEREDLSVLEEDLVSSCRGTWSLVKKGDITVSPSPILPAGA